VIYFILQLYRIVFPHHERVEPPQLTSQSIVANTSQPAESQGSVTATQVAVKTPEVEVYVAPKVESILQSAGITEEGLKSEVKHGLAKHHITCVEANKVLEDMDDWVSLHVVPSNSADSALAIEMSVRNGVSVNYQLVRWEGKALLTTAQQSDVTRVIESLIEDLAANFNSPAYTFGKEAIPDSWRSTTVKMPETAEALALAPAEVCLSYAPAVVTLMGTLTTKTFQDPLSPESGGIPPETFWILNLGKPMCTNEGEQTSPNRAESGIWNLQVLFLSADTYSTYRRLLNTTVKVTGVLFPAASAHHHTKAMVQAARIEPAQIP